MSIPFIGRRIAFPKPPRAERSGAPRERIPAHVRAALWRRDRGRCAWCGAAGGAWEAHRLVPGAVGGRYTLRNLLTLCRPCHEITLAGAPRTREQAVIAAGVERLRLRGAPR